MDVHIEELTADVSVMDDESLLTPAVMRRIVEQVAARLRESDRTRDIAEGNTNYRRAAGESTRR